jgi:hypothetical protein
MPSGLIFLVFFNVIMWFNTTPSVLVYKARANMTRSSKSYFDYSFLLYYISYDYEFIFIGKYI